jgi:hypothetical protein
MGRSKRGFRPGEPVANFGRRLWDETPGVLTMNVVLVVRGMA